MAIKYCDFVNGIDYSDKTAWAISTSYAVNNVRKGITPPYTTRVYKCKTAHTSSASDEPGVGANWTTYWNLISDGSNTLPYKTITDASTRLTGGDEVRVAKSPEPVDLTVTFIFENNSTTVTASDSVFVNEVSAGESDTSIRRGDFIKGGDGNWWEVITVTSTTQAELYQKYSGETASGVSSQKLMVTDTGAASSLTSQVQVVTSSGTASSSMLKISGGWTLSESPTQNGQTFFRQLNSTFDNRFGYGLSLNSENYVEMEKLNFLRYNYGISFLYSSSNTIISLISNSNFNYGIYFFNSSDNTIISASCNMNNNYGICSENSFDNKINIYFGTGNKNGDVKIINESYILNLPFEEGTGTITKDMSGLSIDGAIYGAAWNDGGRVGKCLSFDGNNDYVECGRNGNLDITDKITLEAWVKKSELNRIESIISKGSYGLKVGEDDKPYIELISGSENIVDCGQLGSNIYVYSLAVYDGKLYGGTGDSGRVYRYDGGTTWTDCGQLGSNTRVFSLAVYDGKLYGGTGDSGRVYRYDGGTTWTDCGQLGSNIFVFSLAVYNGNLYGGTSTGYVYRYDGGTTWTDCGQLGSNTRVYSLAVYDGKLYGGTYDSGRVYTIGSGVAAYSETALTTTNYAHIVGTYDGETARIYVDTVKTEKEGSVTIGTNFFNLLIGCSMGSSKGGYSSSGEDYFKGLIDEVRIYNRVLSDTEIQNRYQNP